MIGIENLRINAKLPPTGVTRTGEQIIRSTRDFVKQKLLSENKDVQTWTDICVGERAVIDTVTPYQYLDVYVVNSKKEKTKDGRLATFYNQELILAPDSHLTAISCEFLLGTDSAYRWPVKIAAKTEGELVIHDAFEETEVMLKDRGFKISSEVITIDASKNPSFMFSCEVQDIERARALRIQGTPVIWELELPSRLDFYLINAEVREAEGRSEVWAMPGVLVEASVKARDLDVTKPKGMDGITEMEKFWDFVSIVGLPTFNIFHKLEAIFNKGQAYEHLGYALVIENATIANRQ